jgi:hypothetical protein
MTEQSRAEQSRAKSTARDLLPPEVKGICSDNVNQEGSKTSRMSTPVSRPTNIHHSSGSQASHGAALPALLSRDDSRVFDGLTLSINFQTDLSGHHEREDSPTSQFSDCYMTADESVAASD